MKIWNKSLNRVEKAKYRMCPRCTGFGGIFTDKGNSCHLCKGHGKLWMSTSGTGWCRAKYNRVVDSVLY